MQPSKRKFMYDLITIGGGSGGMSCSKKAKSFGKKVLIADFVNPSPHGTTWGLGGTCINVGCVPKKLMHFASMMGEIRADQEAAGWQVSQGKHDWKKMVTSVNKHVKKLNNIYHSGLERRGIEYRNAYASFPDPKDPHKVQLTTASGEKSILTAENIVVSTGGRPRYLDVPGAKEYCITSDDLFWLQEEPGKTLVIGGGYVGLECAGFIKGLGHEVDLLVRSVCLRGFDTDMVGKVTGFMEKVGVNFLKGSPTEFKKSESGTICATLEIIDEKGVKLVSTREYKTVLFAVGRVPNTKNLGLIELGVKLDSKGKIITDKDDRSSVQNIFAIGDIQSGTLELTPVAIKQGRYLAERLYENGNRRINLNCVPTTIFTPLEYGCVGLSEDKAIEIYGQNNIDVYHTHSKPLIWNFLDSHDGKACYIKAIVTKEDNKVRGIHIVSPDAGEIIQGYAAIVQFGHTFKELTEIVPIHPSMSEEIVLLNTKKETKQRFKL